jgi:hypothetical protein
MASTDKINDRQPEFLGDELGRFFLVRSEHEALGIAESLQVWVVRLVDFRRSLLSKASWKGVWHHQLGPKPGRARIYARSVEGLENQALGIFRSRLAAELDRAIDE